MRCNQPNCSQYVKGKEDLKYHLRVVHGIMNMAVYFLHDAWKAWEWCSKYGVEVSE